jgi:hypothetical protein
MGNAEFSDRLYSEGSMKVLEQTPQRLKLQHFPWSSWGAGSLAVLFSMGSVVYLLGFRAASASLRCQRPIAVPIVSCELTEFTVLGIARSHKLYDLQSATLIRRYVQRRRSTTTEYHVELQTGLKQVALLKDSDINHSALQADVDRINQFISDSTQTSLLVRQSGRLKALLFGLFSLLVFGFGLSFLSVPATTCTFYRRLNKVVLEAQHWYGQGRSSEHPLSMIATVEIEEKRVKNGKAYRTVLVLTSNQRIPLTHESISEKNARETSDYIQKFLH